MANALSNALTHIHTHTLTLTHTNTHTDTHTLKSTHARTHISIFFKCRYQKQNGKGKTCIVAYRQKSVTAITSVRDSKRTGVKLKEFFWRGETKDVSVLLPKAVIVAIFFISLMVENIFLTLKKCRMEKKLNEKTI